MKLPSILSWWDARPVALATGQTIAEVQTSAAADVMSDELQPHTSRPLQKELAELDQRRAELETRQAAQRAIVAEWDGLCEVLERYQRKVSSVLDTIVRMHEESRTLPETLVARLSSPHAVFDPQHLIASAKNIAAYQAALPLADLALQALHAALSQHVAEMRAFGAANKVPKAQWPAAPAPLPTPADYLQKRREEDARVQVETQKFVDAQRAALHSTLGPKETFSVGG